MINGYLRLINNHPKYYKSQLLKKFRERYNFNKLTRGRVNIKQIKKENF